MNSAKVYLFIFTCNTSKLAAYHSTKYYGYYTEDKYLKKAYNMTAYKSSSAGNNNNLHIKTLCHYCRTL